VNEPESVKFFNIFLKAALPSLMKATFSIVRLAV